MQPLPIDGMIILIFLPDVTPTVLEIIRTQNRNFECVRRETKKEKKRKKRKTRDALHKCSMLRIALKKEENSQRAT
jgi:hypothetical protein